MSAGSLNHDDSGLLPEDYLHLMLIDDISISPLGIHINMDLPHGPQ